MTEAYESADSPSAGNHSLLRPSRFTSNDHRCAIGVRSWEIRFLLTSTNDVI